MKRPLPQDSRGLALYMQQQRARQERDERELHGPIDQAEARTPHAATIVVCGGGPESPMPDLADRWAVDAESHIHVEPIALEAVRQLVVGEGAWYHVDFDILVITEAPADPDEVVRLKATVDTENTGYQVTDTDVADTVGLATTVGCSVSATWPLHMADAIRAHVDVDFLRGTPVDFTFLATMTVWWYAPIDLVAPVISS